MTTRHVRKLAQRNSVHPQHRDEHFEVYQHLVFAFHDSTFEAVCIDYHVTVTRGPTAGAVARMVALLDGNAS